MLVCRLGHGPTLGAWSLFARGIGFSETLLARQRFPIVITHPAPILNNAAAKLTKHGSGGHNGNLPRAEREWKDLTLHEIVLLDLAGDDLI